MTPEAIALVQQSFAKVKPIAPQAGLLFYQNLFHIAPELRPLFKADVSDQGRKLMDMLAIAVGMLNQPQRLAEAVTQLGTRHSDYGVEMAHFKPVGTALIMTLQEGLGSDFTPQVKSAWVDLYTEVMEAMAGGLKAANEQKKLAQLHAAQEAQQKLKSLPWWKRLFKQR